MSDKYLRAMLLKLKTIDYTFPYNNKYCSKFGDSMG